MASASVCFLCVAGEEGTDGSTAGDEASAAARGIGFGFGFSGTGGVLVAVFSAMAASVAVSV